VAKDGVSRLGYVNPTMVRNGKRVSMTATGPDPITILRGTQLLGRLPHDYGSLRAVQAGTIPNSNAAVQ